MRFTKSHGTTESERLLFRLCEKTFLKLWTYPNLFRKPGKELIDLLVIFENDVVLFSDKSCSYPQTGDVALDWGRWFRKTIRDSAKQLQKAERWLRIRPDQVFLDRKCTERLPLQLPAVEHLRIHRVCVAIGAVARCHAATGRSSFALNVNILDNETPFTVGRLSNVDGWIHVLDGNSLLRLISELNTVSDFISYLDAKANLLSGGIFQAAASESDLLARYLWYGRTFPTEKQPYVLKPDLWHQVENDPGFQAGRRENEASRFWDGLIEYLTGDYLSRSLEFGNEIEVLHYEEIARLMAAENRFHRRILSKAILDRAEKARQGKIGSMLPSQRDDLVYVLLIGQGAPKHAYAEYRADRSRELQLRCLAAKAARPNCRYVIGIGLDARGVDGSAEDFVYFDTLGWDKTVMEGAEKVRQDLGYFLPGKMIESPMHEDEYPSC